MRLMCPNCAAQYEIDASMIPPGGRDVQCASCGHTWFQNPDDAEEMLADERGVTARDPAFDEPDFEPGSENEPEPVIAVAPAAAALPQTRKLDEAARDILRQEVARESEARRREAGSSGGLESQPDLGLDDTAGAQSRAAAAKARLARLRDAPDEPPEDEVNTAPAAALRAGAAVAAGASRRELLPDIEEINSTLTATGDRAQSEAEGDTVPRQEARRGFRLGFVSVMLIAMILILLYMFAPQISAAVPALSPALGGYLDWANGMLDRVDAGLRWAVDAMGGLGRDETPG